MRLVRGPAVAQGRSRRMLGWPPVRVHIERRAVAVEDLAAHIPRESHWEVHYRCTVRQHCAAMSSFGDVLETVFQLEAGLPDFRRNRAFRGLLQLNSVPFCASGRLF